MTVTRHVVWRVSISMFLLEENVSYVIDNSEPPLMEYSFCGSSICGRSAASCRLLHHLEASGPTCFAAMGLILRTASDVLVLVSAWVKNSKEDKAAIIFFQNPTL